MGKVALISDIHANLEALEAVFAHIDEQKGVEKVYCLGDVVGYGPDPAEVIDIIHSRCDFVLMGNHDHALLTVPLGFNAIAAGAIKCQRTSLEPGTLSLPHTRERWDFLQHLPEEVELDGNYFVHASPRDKIFEYILPTDPEYNPGKMEDIFDCVKSRCFVGHTHIPGVFRRKEDGFEFLSEAQIAGEYQFNDGEQVVFNVSSVGQPRDRDPRACYAILEDERLVWHRVSYDIDTTVQKIQENDCLDDRCGTRLYEGR